MLELTTAAKVKAMKGISGTSEDALIADLILEVSQEAEEYLRRYTLSTARQEVYELRVNQRYLSVDGFPIVGSRAIAVQYASTRDFSSIETLDSSLYSVLAAEGQIHFHSIETNLNPGFVQVSYTGGMAADTDTFVATYPRIAGAVTREVLNRWNRAKNPEGSLRSVNATSVGYEKPLAPLEDFYAALDHHRRIVP